MDRWAFPLSLTLYPPARLQLNDAPSYERGMTKAPAPPMLRYLTPRRGTEPFRVACELNMTLLKCLPERLPQHRRQILSAFYSPCSFHLLFSQYFISRGIRFIWAVGVLNDR